MSTQLGIGSDSDVLSCAAFLNELPVGSVIRNGCKDTDLLSKGVYFLKISEDYDARNSWTFCTPINFKPSDSPVPIDSRFRPTDIFLPVQVMRRGYPQEETVDTVKHLTATETLSERLDRFRIKECLKTGDEGLSVIGGVSHHYVVSLQRSGYDLFEVSDIDTLNDAKRMANALLVVVPKGVARVVEHKFTENTVMVRGPL